MFVTEEEGLLPGDRGDRGVRRPVREGDGEGMLSDTRLGAFLLVLVSLLSSSPPRPSSLSVLGDGRNRECIAVAPLLTGEDSPVYPPANVRGRDGGSICGSAAAAVAVVVR